MSLILRDVFESDLPFFYEQQLDPEATAMADFPSRDRESFMAHWAKIMLDRSVSLKTILIDGEVGTGWRTGSRLLDWEGILGQGNRHKGIGRISRSAKDTSIGSSCCET